jgi:Peptidase family M23
MSDVAPDLPVVTQRFRCTDVKLEFKVSPDVCSTGLFHAGIDLAAPNCCERPLFTSRDGVVHAVGDFPGSGGLGPNAVCIKSDEGPFLIFGHCVRALVQPGQRVSAGQHVADVGTLGVSTDCHLHFEVRTELGTIPPRGVLDPGPFLTRQEDDVTPEELRQALRDVLNEATAPGQVSGAGTIQETLQTTQRVFNEVTQKVLPKLAEVEARLEQIEKRP